MTKRTKTTPKPLFAIKGDFYDSLDAFAHQAGMLASAVRMALDNDLVKGGVAGVLRERLDAFAAVQFGDD